MNEQDKSLSPEKLVKVALLVKFEILKWSGNAIHNLMHTNQFTTEQLREYREAIEKYGDKLGKLTTATPASRPEKIVTISSPNLTICGSTMA